MAIAFEKGSKVWFIGHKDMALGQVTRDLMMEGILEEGNSQKTYTVMDSYVDLSDELGDVFLRLEEDPQHRSMHERAFVPAYAEGAKSNG